MKLLHYSLTNMVHRNLERSSSRDTGQCLPKFAPGAVGSGSERQ